METERSHIWTNNQTEEKSHWKTTDYTIDKELHIDCYPQLCILVGCGFP